MTMYSSHEAAGLNRYIVAADARNRIEDERSENLQRLIAYNNRRIRAGLKPLKIPKALAYPSDWIKPGNRDNLHLTTR